MVNMRLDYLDTSSSKHLYNIFDRLRAVTERGQQVRVNWHYESGDDDMEETGKDYRQLFPPGLPPDRGGGPVLIPAAPGASRFRALVGQVRQRTASPFSRVMWANSGSPFALSIR